MKNNIKIGVFDSGVGGLSVAYAIGKALKGYEVILKEDKEHVPYGLRDPEELLSLVVPIFQEFIDEGCKVIVVACNTVTTTIIGQLRETFDVPIVGVEPMVKPAAATTNSGIIAVCATPATISSDRYKELKRNYAKGVKILEPDCSDWAKLIEDNNINEAIIAERINKVLDDGADVIVLACTHYHWIEEEIMDLAGSRAKVLNPEKPLIEQLKRVLQQLD